MGSKESDPYLGSNVCEILTSLWKHVVGSLDMESPRLMNISQRKYFTKEPLAFSLRKSAHKPSTARVGCREGEEE